MMYSWFIDIEDVRAETCVVAFTCKWLDNNVDNVMLVMMKTIMRVSEKEAKRRMQLVRWPELNVVDSMSFKKMSLSSNSKILRESLGWVKKSSWALTEVFHITILVFHGQLCCPRNLSVCVSLCCNRGNGAKSSRANKRKVFQNCFGNEEMWSPGSQHYLSQFSGGYAFTQRWSFWRW